MTNGTHAAQSKHLDSLAAAAKRYVLSEILDVTTAVSAELDSIADVEFIEGTQTASTGAWTGVTKDSALYKGKFIIYKLPYAGSGNATLNLTLATEPRPARKPFTATAPRAFPLSTPQIITSRSSTTALTGLRSPITT